MSEREIRVTGDVARAAADIVVSVLNEAIRLRGQATFVLSGGGTPLALYRLLAAPGLREQVPWAAVHFFWGDERLVPPDDPGSNYLQARIALLDHLAVPDANIHRVHGEWPASVAVADTIEQLRSAAQILDPVATRPWPRFDLVLLGLGEDGHTASLFPGSPVASDAPAVAVTADYAGRPSQRLTLTPPVFNDARHVMFLVTGASKAAAVVATIRGESDPVNCPAQRIRPSKGKVTWLLDAAAASMLQL